MLNNTHTVKLCRLISNVNEKRVTTVIKTKKKLLKMFEIVGQCFQNTNFLNTDPLT